MKALMLTLLAMLAAQATPSFRFIVPDAPDLMIKTRWTFDRPGTAVTTETLYLKGARQRREYVHQIPFLADISPGTPRTLTSIQITQCDERRMLSLYPEAKTYTSVAIRDPLAEIEPSRAAAAASRRAPPREMTLGPAVTITIDAVDTGEQRRFAHYVARHVITTRTVEPAPGASTPASVDRQDGWYIDVPQMNCMEMQGVVTSFLTVASAGTDRDQVTFKQRGTAPRGYPIEETHRTDGRAGASVTTLQLVEISEAPLDDALFTVPDDYRPALPRPYGGYDPTKPDTWTNRLESYREVAEAWADYVRRVGLLGLVRHFSNRERY